MSFLTPARVAIALFVAGAALLTHLWLSAGFVVFSAASEDKRLVAQVVTRRDFPYVGAVQGYLDIRDALTGEIRDHVFLVARDVAHDVVREFGAVEWRGNTVALDVEGTHYGGPTVFKPCDEQDAAPPLLLRIDQCLDALTERADYRSR